VFKNGIYYTYEINTRAKEFIINFDADKILVEPVKLQLKADFLPERPTWERT